MQRFLRKHHKRIATHLWLIGIPFCLGLFTMNVHDLMAKKAEDHGKQLILHTPLIKPTELEPIVKNYLAQKPNNAKEYFELLNQGNRMLDMIEVSVRDFERAAGQWGEPTYTMMRDWKDDVMRHQATLQQNAVIQFSKPGEIAEGNRAYEEEESHYSYLEPPTIWDYSKMLFLGIAGYIALCCWTMLVYLLPKTLFSEHKLWGELFSFRLLLVMFTHPLTMWAYPWGDPKEQLRRALRRMATFLTFAIFNIAPATAAFAKAACSSTKKRSAEYSLVCKDFRKPPQSAAPPQPQATPPQPHTPAVPAETNRKITYSLNSGTFTQYTGLQGEVFDGYPVQQSQFTINLPSGIYIGTWTSVGLSHRKEWPFGNEIDLFAGYGHSFQHGWNFSSDLTWINASPLLKLPSGDVVQMRASVAKTFQVSKRFTITPVIQVRHFEPLNGFRPMAGTMSEFILRSSYTKGRMTISSFMEDFEDTGTFGFAKGRVFKTGADLAWQINAHVTVSPVSVQTSIPLNIPTRPPQVVIGPHINVNW